MAASSSAASCTVMDGCTTTSKRYRVIQPPTTTFVDSETKHAVDDSTTIAMDTRNDDTKISSVSSPSSAPPPVTLSVRVTTTPHSTVTSLSSPKQCTITNMHASLRSFFHGVIQSLRGWTESMVWRACELTCGDCRPKPPASASSTNGPPTATMDDATPQRTMTAPVLADAQATSTTATAPASSSSSSPPVTHRHDIRRSLVLPYVANGNNKLAPLGFKCGCVPILVAAQPRIQTFVVQLEAAQSATDRIEGLPLGLDRTCIRVSVTDNAASLRAALSTIFHLINDDDDVDCSGAPQQPRSVGVHEMTFMYQEPLELSNFQAQRGWEPTTRSSPWRPLHEHQYLAHLCRQPPNIHDEDVTGHGQIHPLYAPNVYLSKLHDGYGRASQWTTHCPRIRVILPSAIHYNSAMAALMEVSVYPFVRLHTPAARFEVGDNEERTQRRATVTWRPAHWRVLQFPPPLPSAVTTTVWNSFTGSSCSSGLPSHIVHRITSFLTPTERHTITAKVSIAWRYHAWNAAIWNVNDSLKWVNHQLDNDDCQYITKGDTVAAMTASPPPPTPVRAPSLLPIPASTVGPAPPPSPLLTQRRQAAHLINTYGISTTAARVGITSRSLQLYHHGRPTDVNTCTPLPWTLSDYDNEEKKMAAARGEKSIGIPTVRWPNLPWHYHPQCDDNDWSMLPQPTMIFSTNTREQYKISAWPNHFLSTQPPEPSIASLTSVTVTESVASSSSSPLFPNAIECNNSDHHHKIDLSHDVLTIGVRHLRH